MAPVDATVVEPVELAVDEVEGVMVVGAPVVEVAAAVVAVVTVFLSLLRVATRIAATTAIATTMPITGPYRFRAVEFFFPSPPACAGCMSLPPCWYV